MAKKKSRRAGAATSGRTAPQKGGPRGAAFEPSQRGRTGGWRNSKAAPLSIPGATDRTTVGAKSGASAAASLGGGGASIRSRGPNGGSLGMPGVVVVKHPRSGPSQYGHARPGGKVAKKYAKAKAPGK